CHEGTCPELVGPARRRNPRAVDRYLGVFCPVLAQGNAARLLRRADRPVEGDHGPRLRVQAERAEAGPRGSLTPKRRAGPPKRGRLSRLSAYRTASLTSPQRTISA